MKAVSSSLAAIAALLTLATASPIQSTSAAQLGRRDAYKIPDYGSFTVEVIESVLGKSSVVKVTDSLSVVSNGQPLPVSNQATTCHVTKTSDPHPAGTCDTGSWTWAWSEGNRTKNEADTLILTHYVQYQSSTVGSSYSNGFPSNTSASTNPAYSRREASQIPIFEASTSAPKAYSLCEFAAASQIVPNFKWDFIQGQAPLGMPYCMPYASTPVQIPDVQEQSNTSPSGSPVASGI